MAERSLPLTHEDLLARPAREAERILAEIPFRDQLQLVLSTPWALRPRIITLSPLAEGLVRNLPPQELFLTLKAASTDDAIDLLSYAKGEQHQLRQPGRPHPRPQRRQRRQVFEPRDVVREVRHGQMTND